MLAWLVPIGLGLVACGAVPPRQVASVIRTAWLALGIAVIGYWACGFAFQFGGLGFVSPDPELAGLAREWIWNPLSAAWGTGWGMLGLEGYLLRGPASTPAALSLFLSQLPWITTAVAIPLWSLQGRARPFSLFLGGTLTAFLYTLLGNWTWGGGWLANLGLNLNLGHGFIDFVGAGAVHLAGAACALAGMLTFGIRRAAQEPAEQLPLPTLDEHQAPDAARWTVQDEPYVPMPALHLPGLATLGAWLAIIGWGGWVLSGALHVGAGAQPWSEASSLEALVGLTLAAAGGALAALCYCWLTTGQGDALMVARGVMGALVAVSACLPFVPLWAALAIGAGAGLLIPLVQYTVEHLLRLDDPTSAVATHGIPALWGLLALALFADGLAGQGWNRVGTESYLGVSGQGVTGYLAAVGTVSDWPGQFQAQIAGAAAQFGTCFLLSLLLFAVLRGIGRAWMGEYTIRLPRRARAYQRGRPRRQRRPAARRRGPKLHFAREGGEAAPEPAEPGNMEPAAPSSGPETQSATSWWRRSEAAVTGWAHKPAPDGSPDAGPAGDAEPAGTAGPDRPDGERDC